MKEKVLQFIKDNEGCDLIQIFNQFKEEYKSLIIIGVINELQRQEKIELKTGVGYFVK